MGAPVGSIGGLHVPTWDAFAYGASKAALQTYVPLRRPGEPEDIQGLVVFLASRAGAYVNGVTIPLDGGYLAAL